MEKTPRILLVEDEVELAELERDYLRHEGFDVEMRHSGDGVIEEVRASPPDMILLDLMLPGTDGLSICREVRRFSEVPIIMITARVEEIDRLIGLELGADDYICKPFKAREVVARVKAVLRRTFFNTVKQAGEGLQLDTTAFKATYDDKPLDLTTAEFRLLAALHGRVGKVFSRQELLDAIYDDYRDVGDRSVDSHIKNLRRKLAEHLPEGDPIHSVYGIGYKLEI